MTDPTRIELGIDGNCGFALWGRNLQEGQAEFVEIIQSENQRADQILAMETALNKLRIRLNRPNLGWFFGTLFEEACPVVICSGCGGVINPDWGKCARCE